MRIIGIDPGTIRMGYAIIECESNHPRKVLTIGHINLSDIEDHPGRLKIIYEELNQLIEKYHPQEMAIEAPFYGKNVQSMLKLGRAQGLAMTIGFIHKLTVTEYSPKKIKLSISGNGNASKEQIARLLKKIIVFDHDSKYFDATDALAVAICHVFQKNNTLSTLKSLIFSKKSTPSKTSWKTFLDANPHRKI